MAGVCEEVRGEHAGQPVLVQAGLPAAVRGQVEEQPRPGQPESLKPALRRRAAAPGRSVEAEARVILEEAIAADEDFVSWWLDEVASVPPGELLPMPDRGGESRETVTFE